VRSRRCPPDCGADEVRRTCPASEGACPAPEETTCEIINCKAGGNLLCLKSRTHPLLGGANVMTSATETNGVGPLIPCTQNIPFLESLSRNAGGAFGTHRTETTGWVLSWSVSDTSSPKNWRHVIVTLNGKPFALSS
jgi:hypothetical protein